MDLGNRLLELRKKERLSQEEVADKLGVSRQTVSKWETNQSQPDFDKILPLCELFDITTDELLKGEKSGVSDGAVIDEKDTSVDKELIKKRAKNIGLGVLMYFIATAWFMLMPAFDINPMLSIAVFLVICGIGTYIIVYTNIVYKVDRPVRVREQPKLQKSVIGIISMITCCIYLIISFQTFAWHITWIIWIINAVVIEIVKLVFALKGVDDEK